MRRPAKAVLFAAGALTCIALGLVACYLLYPLLLLGSAYKSKVVCSAVFVSKRPIPSVLAEDAGAGDLRRLQVFRTEIDEKTGAVTSSLFGLARRTAVYREGAGATLALGISPDDLRAELPVVAPPAAPDPARLWPLGERVDTRILPAGIDRERLEQTVASAFAEPDPAQLRRTRAVVVVYDGRIVAEQYAAGFTEKTPLAGWSMTKSIANALAGILVRRNQLSLDTRELLPEWRTPGDPRAEISLGDLLRMSSGLAFEENYTDPRADATTMLFRVGDAPGYAAAKPLVAAPGERWSYSSGTTNIISRIIRETLHDDRIYHTFPYFDLFRRIGMHSAVMERDASGNFVASSFMFATARDWARIGLLYGNDGMWNHERILPEGWVEYSRTPAPAAPPHEYGAHFWLKSADGPLDNLQMSGHEGQFVTIIPEKKLIVVRLGLTLDESLWDQDQFVEEILSTLPD